jgi:methyltransferase
MTALMLFTVLILLVGLERLAELIVSLRNQRWSLERGGVEYGRGHYPWMVALHTGLLGGALAEAYFFDRGFNPILGWTMLALVVLAQALRWWCIATLGRQWNIRVIVIPGAGAVERGPYKLMRHPNYLAVIIEGFALPLVLGNWITALAFSLLNFWLLRTRINTENRALQSLEKSAT